MTTQEHGGPVEAGGGFESPKPDDLVERLIRLADSGPELPEDGAERVRASVRPAWLAVVRARVRRRRLLWGGGGLAAAATVVVALWLGPLHEHRHEETAARVATLSAVVGELEVLAAGSPPLRLGAAEVGRELVGGSSLVTVMHGRAALTLRGGVSLRLDNNTSIRLVSADIVDLDRGGIYVDSGASSAAGVEVRTNMGVMRDLGTQFEVRRGGQTLTIRVREGMVSLTRGQDQLEIRSGSQATVVADGAPTLQGVTAFGPEWAWAQAIAPPFAIEGRTATDFLAWVGRETGREVRFADPDVEDFAGRTTLHGSLAGLGPGDAVDLVLPGCGLEARNVDGALVVRQLRGEGGGLGW